MMNNFFETADKRRSKQISFATEISGLSFHLYLSAFICGY